MNICTYFSFETGISFQGSVWGGAEYGNRISAANFFIVFHDNYASNLLSFLTR